MFGMEKKKPQTQPQVSQPVQKPEQKTVVPLTQNKQPEQKKPVNPPVVAGAAKKPIQKQPKVKKVKEVNPDKIGSLDLWDFMASSIAGESLMVQSDAKLSNEQMAFEWGRLVTGTAENGSIIKCFVLNKIDNWVPLNSLQSLEDLTLDGTTTVKFNYSTKLTPHSIDWNSPKMKQQIRTWGARIKNDEVDRNDVFTRRETAGETALLQAKEQSFDYFQKVDLDYRRSIFKATVFVQIIGQRNNLEELDRALDQFKVAAMVCGFNFYETKADILDWTRSQLPTSNNTDDKLAKKIPTHVMSDDTIAAIQGSAQGMIGEGGVPIGLDVYSCLPVFHTFREDKDAAENVLISAGTGGGKSVFVKNMLLWCLAEGMSVCVLDYEGDEYVNIAKYLNETEPGSAVIVNMNAGSGRYFEPLRISSPTGVEDVDRDAKANATDFTKAMIRILLGDPEKDKKDMEDYLVSKLISDIYDNNGITDNPDTWHNSRGLKINNFYDQLSNFIEHRHGIDPTGDDSLQKIAKGMQLKLRKYFVEGESEYGTFGEILNIEDIRDARFIDFSFGNKGADQQGANEIKIALKQLCVSKVTNELSNYNKYVKGKDLNRPVFTLKIWEEVQRFVSIKGAEDIMKNCITGGRKRGDIAFIITNNLGELLDGKTDFMKALKTNLTGYCIGFIPDEDTRAKFCDTFGLQLLKKDLDDIYYENAQNNTKDENGKVQQSDFKNAFLVKFNSTSKSPAIQTVVRAAVAPEVFKRGILTPGKLDLSDINEKK